MKNVTATLDSLCDTEDAEAFAESVTPKIQQVVRVAKMYNALDSCGLPRRHDYLPISDNEIDAAITAGWGKCNQTHCACTGFLGEAPRNCLRGGCGHPFELHA